MHAQETIARSLADVWLAEAHDIDGFVKRGGEIFGKRWRWLRPLARRLADAFPPEKIPPRRTIVVQFLMADSGFFQAYNKHDLRVGVLLATPSMRPCSAARLWEIRPLATPGELAQWLELTIPELEWLADARGLSGKQNNPRLRHYHYRILAKRFGQVRLLEAPKPRLKRIQRRILTEILNGIPPHDAARGFRRGHSIHTFARPHVGQRAVIRIDLENFFPTISAAWVRAVFHTAGYPEEVAALLAALCTTSAPADVCDHSAGRLYARRRLPQGAPTSPALANLCGYRMDCRLAGLAKAAKAVYTRYADDLAFSGDADFERTAYRFHLHACAVAMEEGFAINHRKTRIMKRGVRQKLAGVVVNQKLNVPRREYDLLKATLHNCAAHGPESQNREGHANYRAHLEGKVSFVESVHPKRGRKLRELLERIEWPEAGKRL